MLPILAKILTSDNIHPFVRKAEYAVRGELAIRSEDLKIVRPTLNTLRFYFSGLHFHRNRQAVGE